MARHSNRFSAETLIDNYLAWLKNNFFVYDISDKIIEVTAPLLDQNNDYFQIYVEKKDDDLFRVSDFGETVSNLSLSGVDISTQRRRKIFDSILNAHGVCSNKDNELFIESDFNSLPQSKHLLLQTMQAVSDMHVLSRSSVVSIFKEDVQHFLDDLEVPYIQDISFMGKSNIFQTFDYAIPKTHQSKERLIKTSERLTTDTAQLFVFAWQEVVEASKEYKDLLVFTNHIDSKDEKATNVLRNYNATVIPWDSRNEYKKILIA